MISPKNTNTKNFDFWTKPMAYPLRKMSFFLALFKTLNIWSKNHSFLSKIWKLSFLTWLYQKKTDEKKFDFWTKTMDYPLRKMSIFWHFLKRLLFWSKNHFCLSKISKNHLFWLDYSKTPKWKEVRFLDKNYGLTPKKNVVLGTFLNFSFLV